MQWKADDCVRNACTDSGIRWAMMIKTMMTVDGGNDSTRVTLTWWPNVHSQITAPQYSTQGDFPKWKEAVFKYTILFTNYVHLHFSGSLQFKEIRSQKYLNSVTCLCWMVLDIFIEGYAKLRRLNCFTLTWLLTRKWTGWK